MLPCQNLTQSSLILGNFVLVCRRGDRVDTFQMARARRGRYYRAIILVLVFVMVLAIVIKQLMGSLLGEWTTTVMAVVPSIVLIGGATWAVLRYLRCPGCERFDPILAYFHSKVRTCPRCGAPLP